jgi:PAS domain S-box-containing protein
MIYIDLILNLTLLVSLSIVSGFIEKRWARHTRLGVFLQGLLFGGAAVIGMLRPLNLGSGLIFDGRSVMLSLCALFYGPWAGSIAGAMTILCRIELGGVGTLMGVLVISSSVLIGLLGYCRSRPDIEPPSVQSLYLFGLVVHLAMLALMFTLPGNTGLTVMKRVGPPVILLYPMATILAGKILSDQVSAIRRMADLQMAKQNLSITLQSIGDAVISTNLRGEIVFMNPVAEALTGWSQSEAAGKPFGEVFRVVNEETREKVEDPVSKVLEKGNVVDLANHTLLIARDETERPIADSAAPIRDARGEISGVVLVFRDQSEQRRVERLMRARLTMLEYATTHTLGELLTKALDETSALVGSPIGFYHFLEADEKTLSLQQCSTSTLEEFCRAEGRGMRYPIDQAGVWVDAVHQKKAVVHNDYASLPHRKGLPEGHADVVRELVVPIVREGKVAAILGLGNKPSDYTEKDVETVSYLADVTWQIVDNKRTEEVLRESEMLFRNLFEHHAAVKLIIDPETGNIIDANHAAEGYYGWSRERLRQMRIHDINTLSPEEVEQEMKKARSLGQIYFGFRHRRADGSVRDVEVFSAKIEVKGKDLLHSIVHDVTERKRAEEALEESQQRLSDIIDFLPDATLVIDKKGKVISWNRAIEEMTGIKASIMVGKDNYEYALPFYGERRPILIDLVLEPREDIEAIYTRVEKRETFFIGEAYMPALGGGEVYLSATAGVLRDSKGNTVGAIESIRDVTESKRAQEEKERLEAQLRQAQKMEAVGTLAGGIAHDFNNILAAVIGYAEMALTDLPQDSPSVHYVEQVLNAGHRAKNLVKQILAFSRMKQQQERVVVEIAPLVEEALRFMRASLPTTIEIRQSIEDKTGAALAEATEIHQVLINLCTNAAQAMEERGGILEISLREEAVDSRRVAPPHGLEPGSYLRLTVSDTGQGMDQETLERIFDPYFTTKAVGKGSGLGLAVVHGIVKRHQGAICVCSKPGEGATFSVYLPKIDAKTIAHDDRETLIPKGAGRILLVDDEKSLVDVGQRMLEHLGYTVMASTSSVEALELFKAQPDHFDLVITDYTMPQMTGIDLAKELMLIRSDIPIILCTGFSERITEEIADELHIRALVLKPLDLRKMAEVIRGIFVRV